ncbi:sensor histidine kinase [Cellulophaga sp. E6(2014)]|uniref:sensor histidine kinase n=1 Tax=Cellulophaga TaxID=104264 RepID=UPI000689DF7C|nr:histidine kinase [Cellulophaga sp. E6(2014)]
MIKFLTKNPFWIVQIIGWFVSGLFVASANKSGSNIQALFFLFGSIFIVGIFSTSLLRAYLKKFVSVEKIGIKQIAIIFLGIFLTTISWFLLNFCFGYLVGLLVDSVDLHVKKNFLDSPNIGLFVFILNLFLIIIWTVLYYGIKMLIDYNRSRIDRLRLRDKIKQEQLNILKGHINPEFMFTSLNNIKGLMLEDVSDSRNKLTQLAELLRYSLTKNNINTVLLEEEIAYVYNFIELVFIENKTASTIECHIDEATKKLEIPPMLLLNMIELATKHGVLLHNVKGEIFIHSERREDQLFLTVTHSGASSPKSQRKVLEKSIQQRLKLLYKEEAHFLRTFKEENTILELVLPIIEEKITEV